MGRNVRGGRIVCFSHVALGDYIIHTFNDEMCIWEGMYAMHRLQI